jgi:ankyrin repeat protein
MQPFSQQHPSSSSNAPNSAGNAQPQPNDVSITDPNASSQPQPQNVGPESGAAVMSAHSPAAGMQPMPFPGPSAYAPMPAAMGQEGGCTGAAAQPASAGPATEDTTYSTSTASTATTSPSTSTLAPDANPDKLPPLILAARRGDLPALEALLQGAQADVNQVDGKYGSTALMFAGQEGHLEVVKMLLAAGARVNDANANDGTTALMYAAWEGHIDVVELLVGWQGIKLGQTDFDGNTALHVAAFNNKRDVLLCLLEAGAQVNHVDATDGSTALILAVEEGHIGIVRLLVRWEGIDFGQTDSGGYTALHVAAYSNKPEVVASLLGARADRRCVEQKGRTALALAYDEMHAAVIEVFLQHGEQLVDVDIFALPQNPFTIVIADLQDDRKPPVTDFLAPDQPMVFFNQLTKAMQEDGSGPSMLLWLRSMGMRAATVQQVAHTFASANLAWPAQSGSGKSTNAQQRLAYCFNALSSLPRLGAGDKVVLLYKAAAISAAATGRLSGVALRQLETLAALEGQAAAQLGAAMLEKVVPFCLAKIGLAYEVDSIALKSSLVDEGYCAPVAQAIALGWQAASPALQTRDMTVPAGLTMAQVMQFMRRQTELHAPAEFALAMQRQLAYRDNLSQLQAMLGDGNDEGLHVLFQIHCDQLRQYCEQSLEQESAHTG